MCAFRVVNWRRDLFSFAESLLGQLQQAVSNHPMRLSQSIFFATTEQW
jgi:hypothetical protein